MEKKHCLCDLCGQPVKVAGFSFVDADGPKQFCCEGCLQIFKLLSPEPQLTRKVENI
jgi:hypothetical protein